MGQQSAATRMRVAALMTMMVERAGHRRRLRQDWAATQSYALATISAAIAVAMGTRRPSHANAPPVIVRMAAGRAKGRTQQAAQDNAPTATTVAEARTTRSPVLPEDARPARRLPLSWAILKRQNLRSFRDKNSGQNSCELAQRQKLRSVTIRHAATLLNGR